MDDSQEPSIADLESFYDMGIYDSLDPENIGTVIETDRREEEVCPRVPLSTVIDYNGPIKFWENDGPMEPFAYTVNWTEIHEWECDNPPAIWPIEALRDATLPGFEFAGADYVLSRTGKVWVSESLPHFNPEGVVVSLVNIVGKLLQLKRDSERPYWV